MNDSIEKSNKPTLAASFFKNSGWLTSLLALAIIAVAIIGNYNFSLLGAIEAEDSLYKFTLFTLGYVALVILFYAVISAKTKTLTAAFPMGIGMIFSGILFPLYIYFFLGGEFTTIRIAVAAGLFVFGLIISLITAIGYKKGGVVKYGYYLSAVKNFSLPAIITVAVCVSCIFYLVTNEAFTSGVINSPNGDKPVLLLAYIFIALLFLTMVVAISSKKTEVIDLLLTGSALALPVVFFNIYFLNGAPQDQIVLFAVGAATIIFLIIIRKFVFFNRETVNKEPVNAGYFKAFISKYSFLSAITLGVGIILVAFTFFSGGFTTRIIRGISEKEYVFRAYLVPLIFVVLSLAVVTGAGFVLSLFTVNSEKINFGDFFNIVCIAASIAVLPYVFMYLSMEWLKIAIFAFITISTVVLVSRLRSVRYK